MSDDSPQLSALIRPFLPQDGEPLAVAVSGGPDSMALCRVLSSCAAGPVHALTVDHGLRPDSAQEAQQTGRRVAHWPHVAHTILKRPPPDKTDTKIQEQARADRYRLMADYCAEHGISTLFVAHHRDDQAETFLFRLAKGSGLDGLCAMRTVYRAADGLRIIRPLLTVPKASLIDFCTAQDLSFVTDPSNTDSGYARTRLRHAQAVLEDEGLTSKRLAATAARLARAQDALEFYAGALFQDATLVMEPSRILLAFAPLAAAPEDIRLRVIRAALDRLEAGGEYGPRMEKLERLGDRLFTDPAFKKASLGGCLVALDRKAGRVTIEQEKTGSI